MKLFFATVSLYRKQAMPFIRFFTLNFLLLTVSFAQTAKMSIDGKPQKSPNEFVSASVRDDNGRICAMIKVISDMDGFKYQANNGVVKVDDNPGEDLVYLQPDERVLRIYHTGFEPLQIILSDYGIQLHSKEVWQLRIKGAPKTGDLLPVTVIRQPADAKITIDGKRHKSDEAIKLSKGRHLLKIEKEGYKTAEETIDVSESKVYFNYTLSELDLLAVQIKSVPSGAQILLDGQDKGVTDKGVWQYPGSYRLKLLKPGYVEVNQTINVSETGNNTFSYNLTKNNGILRLTVSPNGARVLINKEDYSNRANIELAPGRYKIEISKSGYNPKSEAITIERGRTINKTYNLIAKAGKLRLSVQPLEAHVILKQNGRAVQSWTGMKYLKNLRVGSYELEMSASGYGTEKKQITIEENHAAVVDVKLKKELSGQSVAVAGIEMVYVKGGTFEMGCTSEQSGCDYDEEPVHRVTVGDFYIGKYEVTQKQWKSVMGTNPSRFKGDNLPVERVSWDDVQKFIRKLNAKTGGHFRLPTEAEWEYAARGGQKSRGYKYAGSNDVDAVAWYDDNSGNRPHPVGTKQANELGIYDMSGNVWERCSDWKGAYSSSAQTNPTGPSSGSYRVYRGGSWSHEAIYCRVAYRGGIFPFRSIDYFGIRLVRLP